MNNSIVLNDLACSPHEYKQIIQMKDDCFSFFENCKMICDTDDVAISMINSMIQRNRQTFQRNMTGCWFEYLDKELSLNMRLNCLKSENEMNIICKNEFYNEYIKYVKMINNFGITSSL